MIEVRSNQVVSQVKTTAASSGASETPSKNGGKTLPYAVEKAEKAEKMEQQQLVDQAKKPEQIQAAVKSLSDYAQSMQRDLEFSVDKDLDQTVIKVVDRDSGDLIRQIPEDIFLELARRLKDDGEFRLLNALG